MKGARFALCVALLATPALADDAKAGPASPPRIAVEPSTFDFGEALPGKTLRKEFRIRNVGGRDLTIDSVSTSCGCTAALLNEKERRIAPGGSATLEVEMRTQSPGPMRKTVLIRSTDPAQSLFKLQISATVVDR